jgi:hypothetical protein
LDNIYLLVALSAAVILNIVASFLIARSDSLDKTQKTAQIVIVWLFPFVASIGMLIFIRSIEGPASHRTEPGGGATDRISQLHD